MQHMEKYLESISQSLESLVQIEKQKNQILKTLAENLTGVNLSAVLDTPILTEELTKFTQESSEVHSLTYDLFMQVTKVYMEEERLRIANNKKKKAARRLSINLGNTLEDFFLDHLEDESINVDRAKDGLIIFSRDAQPVATLKFMTDLGFHRGTEWYRYINAVVSDSDENYGVPNDRVYIIVCSLLNSIEKPHVEGLLGKSITSNWDFLHQKTLVSEYLDKYKAGIGMLRNPDRQVYFMASELHPNAMADELYHAKRKGEDSKALLEKLNGYQWLSDIEKLIQEMNTKL
ncbi:hypothetical protein CBW65_12120 [Tumebacillus avium]|uniref:Uncharacterized protein n=1 Tax=Tumebacillus avium TaxID=1903704 RepID=A0A1Y0IM94_9BACL|nr:hypothetical protein [Tumebacillus avium]ARU61682.1 hypothetical protein CBW65_12120 [Tumebacillus avium]